QALDRQFLSLGLARGDDPAPHEPLAVTRNVFDMDVFGTPDMLRAIGEEQLHGLTRLLLTAREKSRMPDHVLLRSSRVERLLRHFHRSKPWRKSQLRPVLDEVLPDPFNLVGAFGKSHDTTFPVEDVHHSLLKSTRAIAGPRVISPRTVLDHPTSQRVWPHPNCHP